MYNLTTPPPGQGPGHDPGTTGAAPHLRVIPPGPPTPDVYAQPYQAFPRRNRPSPVFWAIIVVAGAQLFLPPEWKPFHQAGKAAAQFHAELFNEVMRKDLEYIQQEAIAQQLAQLQVDSSIWGGYCALASEVDGQAGYWCKRLAGANYEEAYRRIKEAEFQHRIGQ